MPRIGAPVEPTRVERVDPWWRTVAALEKKRGGAGDEVAVEGAALMTGEPID